jgi:hypothetical protein
VTLLLCAGVVAAVALFSQPAPSIPASGLTANCSSPTQLVPSKTIVVIGSTGLVTFTCPSAAAAFHAVPSSQTPTFTLGTGYSTLFVYPHSNAAAATCAATTGSIALTSGSAVSFVSTNDWDYCGDYSGVGSAGLGAWTVSWSAP